MSQYRTNISVDAIVDRLTSASSILISTHAKPDGDAMGSMLALARGLRQKGLASSIHVTGPIEPNLLMLAADVDLNVMPGQMPADTIDLSVILDTGAWGQLPDLGAWLRGREDQVIVIDHHSRGDVEIASSRLVDSTAASTTQVLLPVLEAMGCNIHEGGADGSGSIAEALFVGLATDTGWFRFSNADAEAFRIASTLLEGGLDKSRLYRMIEENHRPARLALTARAIESIEFLQNGAIALMRLRPDDFEDTGGSLEDLNGVVNEPMAIGTVEMSILLTQVEQGLTKASFRSKPPRGGSAAMDVNVFAGRFGGGGHVHAAGARFQCDIDEAAGAITRSLEEDPLS